VRPASGPWGETRALDLESAEAVRALVADVRPDIVVHSAAMTSIEGCAAEPARTLRVNVDATGTLARLGADHGFPIVFLSTEQIFDGNAAPYDETAEPHPVSLYGESKVAAEAALTQAGGEWCTLRLALVYGWGGFGRWMATRFEAGEPVTLFHDQFRTPVHTSSVVEAVGAAIERRPWGEVFHIAGADRVQRVEMGERYAAALGFDASLIRSVRMADVTDKLPRPVDVALVTDKARRMLGWTPLSLDEGLARMKRDREAKA